MEDYKVKANEEFFEKVNDLLKDGGTYIFPAAEQTYTKKAGIYETTQEGLDAVNPLVSKEFFDTYFKLK